jgi:hypothetical protein
MSYIEDHNASGLKVGDRVKITHGVPGYHNGWQDDWVYEMTRNIGLVGKICKDVDTNGFAVKIGDRTYCYPCYVLEKVGAVTMEYRPAKSTVETLPDYLL